MTIRNLLVERISAPSGSKNKKSAPRCGSYSVNIPGKALLFSFGCIQIYVYIATNHTEQLIQSIELVELTADVNIFIVSGTPLFKFLVYIVPCPFPLHSTRLSPRQLIDCNGLLLRRIPSRLEGVFSCPLVSGAGGRTATELRHAKPSCACTHSPLQTCHSGL